LINHLQKIDIDLLVQGDRRQWKKFVRQISPVVFSVIKKTLVSAGRDAGEVHDILQELFVRLCDNNFRLLKSYDPKRARLTTWLAVIARNMAIDYLRRCRLRYTILGEIPDKGPDERSIKCDADHIILSFDVLPPRQMMVMTLLYKKDMNIKEVAGFMGITEQSVRSMRHKAVKKLRRIVGTRS
jgi:RNA polymerase sigma-70 factor (ECF subfamily)